MDRIDHQILHLLSQDGRLSFRELGDAVHLSANAVAERYRRLRESGTIRHIRAVLDPAALGRSIEAHIDIKLRSSTSALEFETALRHLPQVLSATLLTGDFDYSLRVACEGREDLVQLTETLRRLAGVRETCVRLVLRELQLSQLA